MSVSDFIESPTIQKQQVPEKILHFKESEGAVYTAVVQINGKQFFAKGLKREWLGNRLYRSMFRKEFEKGCAISHPNIVQYNELTNNDSECYILMENITGETLDEFIVSHQGYFSQRKNIDKFFLQLLSGLKCLHENHIVHSDIKPQNIMITQVNNDVKIIDLGFCYTDSYINSAGMTRQYAAPEQLNNGQLDTTTDIYCVGKLIEYLEEHCTDGLPKIYAGIKAKCLKEDKSSRYQRADEIIKIINHRKHIVRKTAIAFIALLSLFIAYKIASYNPYVIALWDRFQIIQPKVIYDTEYDKIYYRITSAERKECAAVGATRCVNLYIKESVVINGVDYKVTEIADSAFNYYTHVKSVNIPETVTTIGEKAFHMCKNLSLVNIPNGCTTIKYAAFWGCEKMQHIKLPGTLENIGAATFAGLVAESVEIPEGVTTLPLDMLGICPNLKHVKLPQSLTTISRGVFF